MKTKFRINYRDENKNSHNYMDENLNNRTNYSDENLNNLHDMVTLRTKT
jgi:hypothetical protein